MTEGGHPKDIVVEGAGAHIHGDKIFDSLISQPLRPALGRVPTGQLVQVAPRPPADTFAPGHTLHS